MANNCCGVSFLDGGVLNEPVIVRPDIKGGVASNLTANNLAVNGAVTLDEAAAESFAAAVCDGIKPCIQAAVDNGTFANVTLTAPTLNGELELGAAAKLSLFEQIKNTVSSALPEMLKGSTLVNVSLTRPAVDSPTIKGTVTIDAQTKEGLVEQLAVPLSDKIEAAIKAALAAKQIVREWTLNKATLESPSITNDIIFDEGALASLLAKILPALMDQLVMLGPLNINGMLQIKDLLIIEGDSTASIALQVNDEAATITSYNVGGGMGVRIDISDQYGISELSIDRTGVQFVSSDPSGTGAGSGYLLVESSHAEYLYLNPITKTLHTDINKADALLTGQVVGPVELGGGVSLRSSFKNVNLVPEVLIETRDGSSTTPTYRWVDPEYIQASDVGVKITKVSGIISENGKDLTVQPDRFYVYGGANGLYPDATTAPWLPASILRDSAVTDCLVRFRVVPVAATNGLHGN